MPAVVNKWAIWIVKGGFLFGCFVCADDFQTGTFDTDGRYARGISYNFMGGSIAGSLFSKKGWKALLEDAGFAIVQQLGTVWSQPPSEAKYLNRPETFIIARKA